MPLAGIAELPEVHLATGLLKLQIKLNQRRLDLDIGRFILLAEPIDILLHLLRVEKCAVALLILVDFVHHLKVSFVLLMVRVVAAAARLE